MPKHQQQDDLDKRLWHGAHESAQAPAHVSAPHESPAHAETHSAKPANMSEAVKQAQAEVLGPMVGDHHAHVGGGHEPAMGHLHGPTTLFAKGHGDKNAACLNDIKQGQLGDCFFLSSMGAELQHHPNMIQNMIHQHGHNYTVDFKEKGKNGAYKDDKVTVNDTFPVNGEHTNLSGDRDKHGRQEIWPLIMEKAYAKLHGGYHNINKGGDPAQAMSEFTGHDSSYVDPKHASAAELQKDLKSGEGVTFATDAKKDGQLGYNLVGSHAYTLESIRTVHGKKCAILNNPWGFHDPKPIPLDQLNGRFQEIAVN